MEEGEGTMVPSPVKGWRISSAWRSMLVVTISLLLLTAIPPANAAFVNFQNCLPRSMVDAASPKPLQFVPLYFAAAFNSTDQDNLLNLTVYGNVTGQAYLGDLPPATDPSWTDPASTAGKIVNVSQTNNHYSTIFAEAKVLTFTPWVAKPAPFCDYVTDGDCPVAPAFFKNASHPEELPSFSVTHRFYSTYAFSTFSTRVWVQSGDEGAPSLACVTANVTPSLGTTISDALTYVPAAILILMAISTVTAAWLSPWSSPDPFHWTSNYGRDSDVLRLITPGFGDCLQYIQFIVLAGSLTLNYPGFFQPVVSKVSWSALLFNHSFASGGQGTDSLIDDVYVVNATLGLSALGQLVGVGDDDDIWTGMAVWLAVILGGVIVLCQLAFLIRFVLSRWRGSQDVDRQSKNVPFTLGIVVRVVFNFLYLPIISLTLFQLVVAPHAQAAVTAMAVVLLVLVLFSAIWIFRLIFTTRPRVQLFDHLPTLLLYGPLYNTYSDEAAPFAFIPVLLNSIRGIAIGAIQPSGIAQIVVLAICEVIFLLTLHAFRPFQNTTSMTSYHTFFSVFRLTAILLSVAFVPTLDVTEGVKGWIGYVILLLHAIVLAFGFFLNALQTLIEVFARLAGVGRDERGGLSRVFGRRQLSQRTRKQIRRSGQSDAAMLGPEHEQKPVLDARSRSLSASSGVLLQQHLATGDRSSQGETGPSPGNSTPGGAQSPFTFISRSAAPSVSAVAGSRRPTFGSGGKSVDLVDPYYRPPRTRRPTFETATAAAAAAASVGAVSNRQGSRASVDGSVLQQDDYPGSRGRTVTPTGDRNSLASVSFSPASPGATALGHRNSIVSQGYTADGDPRRTTDYAIREADFYYGVQRGPALSSTPTRRLKTGPADPTSPASSAAGWFRGLIGTGGAGGGRTWPWGKPKHKGFEVVRSKPAAIAMMNLDEEEDGHERYRDKPDLESGVTGPRTRSTTLDSDDDPRTGDDLDATLGAVRGEQSYSDYDGPDTTDDVFVSSRGHHYSTSQPPVLSPIVSAGSIRLPSRNPSKASTVAQVNRSDSPPPPMPALSAVGRQPTVPRRSSKRTSSADYTQLFSTSPPEHDDASFSAVHQPDDFDPRAKPDHVDPRVKTEEPNRELYNVSAYSNFSGTKTPTEYYRRPGDPIPNDGDDDPRVKTDIPARHDVSAHSNVSINKTPVEYLRAAPPPSVPAPIPHHPVRMPFSAATSEEAGTLTPTVSRTSEQSGGPRERERERPMSTGNVARRVGEGMRKVSRDLQGEQAEWVRR